MTEPPKPAPQMVAVPADLLTRAVQLLGELPSKHSAKVYVDLIACKTASEENPAPRRRGKTLSQPRP